jgi:hypothetical protein
MKRLCLTIAFLASAVAWTQASAQDLSTDPPKPAPSHAAKAKHPVASKSANLDDSSLNDIRFSNPYAPPEGATAPKRSDLVKRSDFPFYSYPTPKEPKGGLSISMGKDGGGHTTGGLSWGF